MSMWHDLLELVDKSGATCLNEDPRAPASNLWTPGNAYVCRSRDDEQLLLTIPFTQEVKIFAIDMVSQEDEEAAPSTVRLYVNQDGMTFSDVDDVEPVQILELSASDLSPDAPTKLKFTKFQQVSTITIFIEDNNGADYSVLSSLRLFGAPTSKCDMSAGLQKC